MEFAELVGHTLAAVNATEDEVHFELVGGKTHKLYHPQDCCERVYVDEIHGELSDLVGSPILLAEESSETNPNASESGTWTFYKLATHKGHVTIRFNGESNGYYSESVHFA
jgi:hypothetical protein